MGEVDFSFPCQGGGFHMKAMSAESLANEILSMSLWKEVTWKYLKGSGLELWAKCQPAFLARINQKRFIHF